MTLPIGLVRRKRIMVEYLYLKLQEEDWHGVCDAANDLREIEMELRIWKEAKK